MARDLVECRCIWVQPVFFRIGSGDVPFGHGNRGSSAVLSAGHPVRRHERSVVSLLSPSVTSDGEGAVSV